MKRKYKIGDKKKFARDLGDANINISDYIPAAIEAARSIRIAYVAFLLLLFASAVTLLQADGVTMLLQLDLELPILSRNVPLGIFFTVMPVVIVCAYCGLMMRVFSLRRILTVCCYDSSGKIRKRETLRKVKNVLPSFDPALAFSPVPLGRIERTVRMIATILTLVLAPWLFLFSAKLWSLSTKLQHVHMVLGTCLILLPLIAAYTLFWPATTRVPKIRLAQKIGLLSLFSLFFFSVILVVFIAKPQAKYDEWNAVEKWWWGDPKLYSPYDFAARQAYRDKAYRLADNPNTFDKTFFSIARSRSLTRAHLNSKSLMPEHSAAPPALPIDIDNPEMRAEYVSRLKTVHYPTLWLSRLPPGTTFSAFRADGATLSGQADMIRLFTSSFVGTTLEKVHLNEAFSLNSNFENTLIRNSSFINSSFNGASFEDSRIERTSFKNVAFKNSSFSRSQINAVSFIGTTFGYPFESNSAPDRIDASEFVGSRWMSLVSTDVYNDNIATSITNTVFLLSEAEKNLRKGETLSEFHSAITIDDDGNVHIYPTMMDYNSVDDAVKDKPSPVYSDSVLFRYYYFLSRCYSGVSLDNCQLPFPHTTAEGVNLEAVYSSAILKDYIKVWESPLLGNGVEDEFRSIYISSPSLCFLALYAKELSDIERASICPIRYGSAEAKLIREHLVTSFNLPEPYGISEEFGYELCEYPLVKKIWTSTALGAKAREDKFRYHCQITESDYGVYYMFNSREELSEISEQLSSLFDQKSEYLRHKYSRVPSE